MAESSGSQSLVPRARNIVIFGGSFTTVGGNMTIGATERHGLKLLLTNIAPGAFHDAAERGDPPKCHPRTRVAILNEIMQWITDPKARQQFIIWLYGPAGSGKTAIAQSIAEACAKEGLLAASFFFGRHTAGRNTLDSFVATIAYQLSRYIPEIEDKVMKAIEKDPAIFSRSLSTQMRVLIIDPLTSIKLASLPKFVVVDGVDECGPNEQEHAELLNVLAAAVRELKSFPIIFLIGSRPEYEIRTAFNKHPLSSLTKSLVLDDTYQPDKDIKTYLESRFCEIRQEHLPLVTGTWPAESDINFLVKKASGQFVFASTVIKYIDSPRHNPNERLKIILQLSNTGNETPFALLDALYRFILTSVADVQQVLDVLMLSMYSSEFWYETMTIAMAGELLGFDIQRALVDMHSLLLVPPRLDSCFSALRIHHASLYDFLMDRSRSGEYYIDQTQGHLILSRRWLRIVSIRPQFRICKNLFSVDAFNHHFWRSPAAEEIANDLARFDLRSSLEGISDVIWDLYCPSWSMFMEISKVLGGDRDDVFPRLQNAFASFILDRIARYPPPLQSYILIQISARMYCKEVWDMLLHAVSKSAEEYKKLLNLDRRLLHLFGIFSNSGWHYMCDLLQETNKHLERFPDARAHAAMILKELVTMICPKPEDGDETIWFEEMNSDIRICIRYAKLDIFKDICQYSSTDLDLANFLLDRAVQFRNDVEPMPGRRKIAQASIEYIQRCGIPFLEHAHQLDINECAICTMCEGAIVVGNILNISLPPPEYPLGNAEDIVTNPAILDSSSESSPSHAEAHKPMRNGSTIHKTPLHRPTFNMKWLAEKSPPIHINQYLNYGRTLKKSKESKKTAPNNPAGRIKEGMQ